MVDGWINPISQLFIPSESINFVVQGLADFNGDTKADILFRDHLTGQGKTFLVDGISVIQANFTHSVYEWHSDRLDYFHQFLLYWSELSKP